MINFIDVGSDGKMVKPWLNYYGSINTVLSFDPIGKPDYAHRMRKKYKKKVIIYNCAIFDEEGKRPFYVYKYKHNSSLFKVPQKYLKRYIKKRIKGFDLLDVLEIDCFRLDTIINDLNINFDFLKIDTQGADYNVIKSLGKYIGTQIIGIYTELFFKKFYKGAVLFDKTHKFLKKHKFQLVRRRIGIGEKSDRGVWGNFLYLRKDSRKKDKYEFIKKIYKLKVEKINMLKKIYG